MKCIKVFGYVLLALLFISTVPYAAEAGSVKIYPGQFKPINPSNPSNYQTALYLYGDGGDARYYAIVKLPAGKRVTRLVAYHRAYSSSSCSDIHLERCKFGPTDDGIQDMGMVTACGSTGDAVETRETTAISYANVKSGFRYQVKVLVRNGARLHGVKVIYE